MGRPRPGEVLEGLGVGDLRKVVGPLRRPADAEVADGQNVLPAEVEHEKHVRAPPAEALDGGYLDDHLIVREVLERAEIQLAGDDAVREVSQVPHLWPGEAARPQKLLVGREQLLWRRWAAVEEIR